MIPLFWWKNMLLPRCHVDLPIGVAFHCFPSMMMIHDVLFKPTKWETCSSLARWQVSRCKWTRTNNITTKHLHVNMNTSNHHPHHYHQQRQHHHHDPHPHHCHHQVQRLFLPHHFVTLAPRCQSSKIYGSKKRTHMDLPTPNMINLKQIMLFLLALQFWTTIFTTPFHKARFTSDPTDLLQTQPTSKPPVKWLSFASCPSAFHDTTSAQHSIRAALANASLGRYAAVESHSWHQPKVVDEMDESEIKSLVSCKQQNTNRS